MPVVTASFHSVVGDEPNQRRLDLSQVAEDVVAIAEPDDGVSHQLTRTVIGGPATPVHVERLDAASFSLDRPVDQILLDRAPA
jgi:hypothetical protein